MDVDGSAERREPVWVWMLLAWTRTETSGYGDVERGRQGARYERQIYGSGMEEGQTCPGCRPGENGERRDDVEENRSCGGREGGGGGGGAGGTGETQRELVML